MVKLLMKFVLVAAFGFLGGVVLASVAGLEAPIPAAVSPR